MDYTEENTEALPVEEEEENVEAKYDEIMYPGLNEGVLTVSLAAQEINALIALLEFAKGCAVTINRDSTTKMDRNQLLAASQVITNADYFMDKIMAKAEVGLFDDTPTH